MHKKNCKCKEMNKEQERIYNKHVKSVIKGNQINKFLPSDKKPKKKNLEIIFIKKINK